MTPYLRVFRFLCAISVSLAASALSAAAPDVPLSVSLPGDQTQEAGGKLVVQAVLKNVSERDLSAEVESLVQSDPALYSKPAPLARYGNDVALGTRSWAQTNGEAQVERNEDWGRSNGKLTSINAMTDGKLWTEFGTVWNNNLWTESFGYIDLGRNVRVVHMAADIVRDANMIGKTDFSASADGREYTPIEGLQGVDYAKGQGRQEIDVPKAFTTRFIRMRLHHDGQKTPYFRYPADFHVYAGEDDKTWEFPHIGATVMTGRLTQAVAAHAAATVDIGDGRALQPGAYLVAVRTKAGDITQLTYSHIFVTPPAMPQAGSQSRFGINIADPRNADSFRRQGNRSVRLEMKWPAVSPTASTYRFDAPVPPLDATYDSMLRGYHGAGFQVLPCFLQTPSYLVPEKPKGDKSESALNPPTDLSKYGEFVFQAVARYGGEQHPASELLSEDKLSGLGCISECELWNEPGTDNTGASKWKGAIEDYYTMFRIGAEAARKADPRIKILNGAWSHPEIPLLESTRNFKYPDGKCPLDFTDVLGVQYFSQRVEPELATIYDISHHHEGAPYDRTVEQDFEAMVAWRDTVKPSMPIYVTAAGHDGMVDDRLQACWLARGALTALAAGVDRFYSGGFQWSAGDIVRPKERSPKPAWLTYATLIRQLDGVTGRAQKLPTRDDNTRACLWKQGDKLVVTAWTLAGVGKLNIPMGNCTVTDSFGSSQAQNIKQSLDLTEFPVYVTAFTDPSVVKTLQQQADDLAQATQHRLQRQAKLQTYLFNFGQRDREASLLVGLTSHKFTGVKASDLYDDAKGYGFETKGLADVFGPWFQNPLTETSVHVNPGTRFTFKAKPGEYALQLLAWPSDKNRVVFKGLDGDDKIVEGSPSNIIARTTLKIGDKPVTLEVVSAQQLAWMSLVEIYGGKDR